MSGLLSFVGFCIHRPTGEGQGPTTSDANQSKFLNRRTMSVRENRCPKLGPSLFTRRVPNAELTEIPDRVSSQDYATNSHGF